MNSARTQLRLANFIAFQAGWFACVLGAAHSMSALGEAGALLIVISHVARAPQPRAELTLVLLVAVIGTVWDSAVAATGLISYPHGVAIEGLAPAWIVTLWMLFATTLNVSLDWLQGRIFLAAILGAIGGPISFYAGARLGAVELTGPTTALWVLAAGWAALTPSVMLLAARFNGYRQALGA